MVMSKMVTISITIGIEIAAITKVY